MNITSELKSIRKAIRRTIRNATRPRVYMPPGSKEDLVAAFNRLYFESTESGGTWVNTRWFGTTIFKCPLDLWVYQEILCELRPDLIIETGTFDGGSALYLAHVCDILGHGQVITVDIAERPARPEHTRITYLLGSSSAPAILETIQKRIHPSDTVLVILDSNHSCKHVLDELKLYAPLVTKGSYVIVEDTNLNGHPVAPEFGEGPYEAVTAFLASNHDFDIDAAREKFMLTFNPNGYLKRIR